jgi:hypothetical protein
MIQPHTTKGESSVLSFDWLKILRDWFCCHNESRAKPEFDLFWIHAHLSPKNSGGSTNHKTGRKLSGSYPTTPTGGSIKIFCYKFFNQRQQAATKDHCNSVFNYGINTFLANCKLELDPSWRMWIVSQAAPTSIMNVCFGTLWALEPHGTDSTIYNHLSGSADSIGSFYVVLDCSAIHLHSCAFCPILTHTIHCKFSFRPPLWDCNRNDER